MQPTKFPPNMKDESFTGINSWLKDIGFSLGICKKECKKSGQAIAAL